MAKVTNAHDGTEIALHHWPHPGARAQVLVLHGYGEHAGRYRELAEALTAAGYDVVACDHRGHGSSGGHRAASSSASSSTTRTSTR
jgi:alpha-beta hydrolase superfamily lysophospholipase